MNQIDQPVAEKMFDQAISLSKDHRDMRGVKWAYAAAEDIKDEKMKARALWKLIKQIENLEKRIKNRPRRAMLALLIAAHDEELVIRQTITSAIKAGMKPEDIYVVDDNSSDGTNGICRELLGDNNVLKVGRSGKGVALDKGAKHFGLTKRYDWIHIADADGAFDEDYFRIFRGELRSKYAAATGYVRSLPGDSVSQFRVFEYTIGLEIHRRFQTLTNTVPVIPGPTSCFRADVFEKLDFANHSLTEDFDVTLQLHRQKLGKIQFIPDAVAYTQDPKNVDDFVQQISRWNRGLMQGIRKHRVGLKASRIDAYLSYQIFQNLLFFANYFVILPLLAIKYQTLAIIAQVFLFDIIITFCMVNLVAVKARRPDILSAFPMIYAFRWVAMYVFMKSFVEVMILGRFKTTNGTWRVAGRRYKLADAV